MNRTVVTLLAVFVVARCTTPTPQRRDPSAGAETAAAIRSYLERLEPFGFSGALLVSRDGQPVVETAHGLADRAAQAEVRHDTIFDIGSITKQFTAAAILILAREGKLRVSDSLGVHFDSVPDDKKGITLHHLLTHTAGLQMNLGTDYEKVSRAELVRRAMQSELQSAPGERHSYSNAGYSLLAALVEMRAGQSYESFLRTRLFEPAGLTSTGYFLDRADRARFARGTIEEEDWGLGADHAAKTGGDFWNLLGNGGIHSTVGDMHRWMLALQSDAVLDAASREQLFHRHSVASAQYGKTATPLYYGYGWYVWPGAPGGKLIFHHGGNTVFLAALRWHVDTRTIVSYASNAAAFDQPHDPLPAVERMLAGERVDAPLVVTLEPAAIRRLTGRYVRGSNVLTVTGSEQHLVLQGEGQEALALVTGRRWKSDAELHALNQRTAEAVEHARLGRFGALQAYYGAGMTEERLAEYETRVWREWAGAHGPYVRTRVLGTIARRNRRLPALTYVAIEHERGTVTREYLWTPEKTIGDLGPVENLPSARYLPVSSDCFVSFDAAAAELSRICFGPATLTVTTDDGVVVMRRAP